LVQVDEVAAPAVTRRRARNALAVAGAFAVAVLLFLGYWHMAREQPADSDGASNALQAWDLLHGDLLLSGWTVSDVPFYTTELPQLALLEMLFGLRPDVVHLAVAMTYTLLVVLAAVLARGRATGAEGAVRMALAVAVMLVPMRGAGFETLLSSPNHTGTGVPILVTWLVIDRALSGRAPKRWLPYAVAVLLVWGQLGDPLVTYVAALPLALVSMYRLWRSPETGPARWRGADGQLLAAAVASVVLTKAVLAIVRAAGGFFFYAVPVQFAPLSALRHHAWVTIQSIAVCFGAYPPDAHTPFERTLGVLHLAAIGVVTLAVLVASVRLIRRPRGQAGDRIADLLVVGIAVNIGAYLITTMPSDVHAAHEIVAVLPLGAALAGRIWGPAIGVPSRSLVALAAVLAVLTGSFLAQSVNGQVRPVDRQVADWLASQDLRYGLGGYWNANSTTLATSGRVQVVPILGYQRIYAYRWESRREWYDPALHDARFIVIDVTQPTYGTVEAATAQYGEPVQRVDFGTVAVLRYDHNLLIGLTAFCGPQLVVTNDKCVGE
jgi:hypothetical protein